jgi:hypothetical protein
MYIEWNKNTNMYINRDPHITLFWCDNLLANNEFIECFNKIENISKGL